MVGPIADTHTIRQYPISGKSKSDHFFSPTLNADICDTCAARNDRIFVAAGGKLLGYGYGLAMTPLLSDQIAAAVCAAAAIHDVEPAAVLSVSRARAVVAARRTVLGWLASHGYGPRAIIRLLRTMSPDLSMVSRVPTIASVVTLLQQWRELPEPTRQQRLFDLQRAADAIPII